MKTKCQSVREIPEWTYCRECKVHPWWRLTDPLALYLFDVTYKKDVEVRTMMQGLTFRSVSSVFFKVCLLLSIALLLGCVLWLLLLLCVYLLGECRCERIKKTRVSVDDERTLLSCSQLFVG